jgi:hypothetical protein
MKIDTLFRKVASTAKVVHRRRVNYKNMFSHDILYGHKMEEFILFLNMSGKMNPILNTHVFQNICCNFTYRVCKKSHYSLSYTHTHKTGPPAKLTPRSGVLEKLLITKLIEKFPACYENRGIIPCSKYPTTDTYPEPEESNSNPHILFP